MQNHPVVSQEEWLTARKALLLKEKEATHLRDKINAERLALPWVKVEKKYVFDTPAGRRLWLTCSMAAVSSSSITSCLVQGGPRVVPVALPIRPYRWSPTPSESSRCHDDCGITRATSRDRNIQDAHGLAVSVGVRL